MHTDASKKITGLDALLMAALVLLTFLLRLPASWLSAAPEEMRSLFVDADEGLPYLADMDSYYYYRITAQLEETGTVQGEIDPLRGIGETETSIPILLNTVALEVHRVLRTCTGVSLYAITYWLCAVLGALAAVPVYLYGKRLGGRMGGTTAAVLTTLSARFLSQTSPGVMDTDVFNVLLPLLCVFFLSSAMRARKPLKAALYAVLSAGAYGLFTLNWVLAVYMLLFMALFTVFYCPLALILRGKVTTGEKRRLGGVMVPLEILALMVLISGSSIIPSLQDIFGNAQNSVSSPVEGSFLAYTMVISEMKKGDLFSGNVFLSNETSIVNALGGAQCVVFALLGFAVLTARLSSRRTEDCAERRGAVGDWLSLLLLTLLYMIATYAGYRFVMLLALPVGIYAGVGIAAAARRLGRLIPARGLRAALQGVLCLALCAATILGAASASSSRLPQANAEMDAAMTYMRENTPEDAVIVAWWDNGYYYEYASERRTVYDGGRNWEEYLYYMSCVLTSADEEFAANALRMMAFSDMKAHTYLAELTGSNKTAARILRAMLAGTAEEAQTMLTETEGFTAEEAVEAAALSHPENEAQVYFVFSSDMLAKAGWYFYLSGWDFEGAGGDTSAAGAFVSETLMQLQAGQRSECFLGTTGEGLPVYAVATVSTEGQLSLALESRDGDSAADCTAMLSHIVVTDEKGIKAEVFSGTGGYTLALLMQGDTARPVLLTDAMASCWYVNRLMGAAGSDRFTLVHENAYAGGVIGRFSTLDSSQSMAGAFSIWEVK